jgi:hypothetical protein
MHVPYGAFFINKEFEFEFEFITRIILRPLSALSLESIIKDEVLITVSCPIFPSTYIDSQISVHRKLKK